MPRIKSVFCNWQEFDEYELDKKYNLVCFGEDMEHVGYEWYYDLEKDVNVYVR